MVSRLLSHCSLVCCALVLGSFAYFAFGQADGASKNQVSQLGAPDPSPMTSPLAGNAAPAGSAAPASSRPPAQPRRFVDGASHVLTTPFRSFFSGESQWAQRISITVLALLLYGLGLGYLARLVRV